MLPAKSKKAANEEVCDFVAILEKFGKYHVIQYILLCLPAIFITMININYVFVAGDVNYRCRVPECEDGVWSPSPLWWPPAADRCSRPRLRNNATCARDNFTDHLEPCTEWIYEHNNTIIAELNLACQPWLSNIIGTVHSFGMLVSMVIGGWMCDRFGRKPTLIFTVVGTFIGQAKTFATSYNVYITIEFLEAVVSGGSYAAAMILMLEIASAKNRVVCGVVFAYAIYVGEALFAIIAMIVPYWKNLLRIINGPTIIFICYIFLIKESPRWQILNGKTEQAKKTMFQIAKMNKLNVNYQELRDIDGSQLREKFKIESCSKREGLKELVTSKVIVKRLMVAAVCRFTSSFVYYGLTINSVFLPGSKYTNFLLSTVMSFPGELIALYLMTKISRKLPLMFGYILTGILCIASGLVPDTYTWAKIALFLVGKMIIAACFTGAITYSMELFPTSTRGSLLGLCAFTSRAGGMLAPLTPLLSTISEILPSLFFGASAIITGCLVSLIPETKDMPLMDTIQQVEDYERRDRIIKSVVKKRAENPAFKSDITTHL